VSPVTHIDGEGSNDPLVLIIVDHLPTRKITTITSKMVFSISHSLFLFLGLASATYICDASNASVPSDTSSTTTGGSSSSGGETGSGSDSTTYVDPSAVVPAANIGAGFSSFGSDNLALSGDKRSVAYIQNSALRARASSSIECQDQEVCYIFADAYMCIDSMTYDFEDSNGGSGNLGSGIYTMQNGQATSLAATATALPTPTSTAAGSDAENTASSEGSRVSKGVDGIVLGMLAVIGAAGILS
jgi:hypothetical protein